MILRPYILLFAILAVMPFRCENNAVSIATIISKPIVNYNELRTVFKIPDTFIDSQIDTVIEISKRMQIPKHISFNLIFKESRYDSTAVSSAGCYGFTQLHPRYFKSTTSHDNLVQGLGFLKKQYDRFNDWERALMFYNSGEKMYRNNNFVNYILTNGK